jgi:hypothetical protein
MQAVKIQNCRPPGYGTLQSDWWVITGVWVRAYCGHLLTACEDTSKMFLENTHNHVPECMVSHSRTLINPRHFEHLISCLYQRILRTNDVWMETPHSENWGTEEQCVFLQYTIFNVTYFFHQLCTQHLIFCFSDGGYETWNIFSLEIRVRITYDEFQFS